MAEIKKGLEGIFALETKISYIDGEKGILEYRGININDLINLPYEAVSYLLIHGEIPNKSELNEYIKNINAERELDEETINVIRTCNFNIEAMDALRTATSHISHCDLELNDKSREANIKKSIKMIATFPTIVAAFYRINNLHDPVSPDKNLSHGANFLYMLRGNKPNDVEVEVIEKDFILSAEHELNASTFSARVTASTLSDLYSAICSGLGTLKGPIHGGARLGVMRILENVKSPEEAKQFTLNQIINKKRIMGFGHRVYKTYDPRAVEFKKLAKKLAENKNDSKWYEIGEAIEKTVISELVEKRGKPIYPNVDFWAGVVYKYLDIDPLLATSIFAIGRISGWLAHCIEQYSDNRLIRPRAKYSGAHNIELKKII